MTYYRGVKRESPGLVIVSCPVYGERMWTLRTLRNRRTRGPKRVCACCSRALLPGEPAYGPEGNGADRAVRICPTCIEEKLCPT